MTPRWQDVRCASIPVEDLWVLADLRGEPAVRVTIAGERAWVCWDDGPKSEVTRKILLGRLLPLAGVEIFAPRDGRWYRPGEALPAFDVPIGEGTGESALDRLILPEPLVASRPEGEPPEPVRLRVVRDQTDRSRPATAVRCRLADLAHWAEHAPSSWIESLSAAWSEPPGGDQDGAEVLILAAADLASRAPLRPPIRDSLAGMEPRPPGRVHLPALEEGTRFWGSDVLIPLGHRPEPDLADRALRQAVGAGPDDLVVLDDDGVELIPRPAFRPLSRAGIRLARGISRRGAAGG
jgi:MoxR-vWA-beta-propeller ternary system domain bpX2